MAPVGFEIDRVAEPIIRMRGELAILLANSEGQDVAGTFRGRVQDKLTRARIPSEVVRAPIFDFYATTEAILQIFRARREDGLYFNLSSGSKVQALSGYMAANIARAEGIDVEPYYAEPAKYAPTEEEPLSTGFVRAFSVPRLAVRIPGSAPRAALRILSDGPVSKLALAVQLARRGVLDPERLDSKGRPRDDASRVSLQTALDSRVIRPLTEWGFVSTERVGKRIRVRLTDEGKLATRLYPAPG